MSQHDFVPRNSGRSLTFLTNFVKITKIMRTTSLIEETHLCTFTKPAHYTSCCFKHFPQGSQRSLHKKSSNQQNIHFEPHTETFFLELKEKLCKKEATNSFICIHMGTSVLHFSHKNIAVY